MSQPSVRAEIEAIETKISVGLRPVQEIIDRRTGSGARLAACIAGQCGCAFRDRQRQPGAYFPRPRPGRFFDGTRPAELLSRCALVIADLSLHPVSFRETFVTRLYRFSTVIHIELPLVVFVRIAPGLGRIEPTNNLSLAKQGQQQIGTLAFGCSVRYRVRFRSARSRMCQRCCTIVNQLKNFS